MGLLTEFPASFEAFQTFGDLTVITGLERLSLGNSPLQLLFDRVSGDPRCYHCLKTQLLESICIQLKLLQDFSSNEGDLFLIFKQVPLKVLICFFFSFFSPLIFSMNFSDCVECAGWWIKIAYKLNKGGGRGVKSRD